MQDRVKLFLSDYGAQTGKIIGQGREDTEPVNAVVYLQALDGTEPVIGLDDLLGNLFGGTPIQGLFAHALIFRERLPHHVKHRARELFQIHWRRVHEAWVHDATAALAGIYFFALSASRCTSSNDGI